MFRNLLICGVAIAVIATSCERLSSSDSNEVDKTKDWTEVVTMVVSHEIGTVYDMEGTPSEGMLVKEDGKKDWTTKCFGEIAGFEYVRGFEYHLKIEKTHLIDPPQDAPSVRYKLIEILSEEFKLDEGYVMSDEYIIYPETAYREEIREPLSKKQNEYYITIDRSKEEDAVSYFAENGLTIMEFPDEGTGSYYPLYGKLQDCFQVTVKGTGDIDKVPGMLYISPIYTSDGMYKGKSFGRGNIIAVGWSSKWDDDKISRYKKYIEKYADLLNLDYIGTESRYMKYGITKESAGNTVQIYNWFVEVIEDILIDIQFPEWAPTPGAL